MKYRMVAAAVLIALFAAGCEGSGYGTKQTIGGLAGGSSGAKTGAKVGAGASLLTKGESLNVPAGTLLETALRVPLTIS